MSGEFRIKCDTDKQALKGKSKWIGYRRIEIKAKNKKFLREGTYYCAVNL